MKWRDTNMKKISVISLLMALLMLVLCACGTTEEVTSEEESSISAVTPTPKPTPEMKTIGAKTESETAVAIEVKNYTGEAITSWKVKFTGGDAFSENMLEEDDIYLQNGTRMLYLDPKTKDTSRLCDIELTFGDVTATIHNFPLDDADYVELRKEDNVVYLIYESLTSKKEISTLEDEQAIAAAKEAEEAAKAAAQTKSSGSSSGGSSSYSGSSDYSGSSGYSEPSGGGGSDSSSGGDDGCIGDDGLLY